jgi:putative endonuclease
MHPTYKRMLAGLEKKKKASLRVEKTFKKLGDRHSLTACPLTKKSSSGNKSNAPWSLYILKCSDGSFYTGITNDLERRFKMHQAGKASRYTRSHSPVEMLYSEKCGDRSSALIRECEVKEWPRSKKAGLISGEWKELPRKKRGRKTGATVNAQRAT